MAAKRHVVKNMRLNEISSVDRPAQVGAVSVLIKRATPDADAAELLKATFKEALDGRLIDEKVQRAFYSAFDNLWTGQDAFRKALSDELRAGGDGETAAGAYKDWINDLIDKAVAAAKDAGAGTKADALEKTFTTTLSKAAARLAEEQTMTIKTKADLTAAIEKAQADGDKLTVGTVATIHKAAADLGAEDLLPVAGPLAKGGASKDDMSEEDKKKLKRMAKREELSADLRKHYDALTNDADRDAFLSKSADEQAEDLRKAAGDDPVVYTTLDGVSIRKSAGETTIALAKKVDEQARELAKSNARAEDVELTKRAGDLLGNVGGELVGKKALLKAVGSISDEATRTAAEAVLKAANEAGKGAFRKSGSTTERDVPAGGDGPELTESEAKLDEMAKAHAKEHNVTFEKAYSEVIQTTEGAELYKRFVAGE